jgi:hypothetical protein
VTKQSFYDVLNAAIADLMEHGYDSQERLDRWLKQLAEAAQGSLVPEYILNRTLKDVLERLFARSTTDAKLKRSGVSAFTIHNVKPKLRAELQRRILASAQLIKLNREVSIGKTLQRFAGWASSVPAGGTEVGKRKEVKKEIKRGIAGLPFIERRVIIDQGHKLNAAINEIVATEGGAIAGKWRHHRQNDPSYQARPEHVARDGQVFLVRGSWADEKGFVKGPYTDSIEQPAELPFCSCTYMFIFALSDIPTHMLTTKGKQAYLEMQKLTA